MNLEDHLSLSLSLSLFSFFTLCYLSVSYTIYKYIYIILTGGLSSSIIWLVFNMSKGSQRVTFMSPNFTDEQTVPLKSLKSYLDSRSRENKSSSKNRISDLLSASPARLLNCIKNSVRRTFSLLSRKQRSLKSESPSEAVLLQFVPPRDSHHSEAMEDCIEFINSSYRKSL